MPIPPEVVKCYKYIDSQSKNFIEELRQIVKIPNVSADSDSKTHITKMIYWMFNRLKGVGFRPKLIKPDYEKYEGQKPYVIIATLETCPKKKTLLYYCHLDVLKVLQSDWKQDPFELIQIDGKLHGRGSAKMKGPLLCFIHAIESYVKLGIEIPINIKVICESMYECRSRGLENTLYELKGNFLSNIDCVLITDSNWIGPKSPCIIYGTRGVCYFKLIIEGPKKNLNSGHFGGIVYEPMQDFLRIVNGLIDHSGHIKVPNFYDDIHEVTPDEEEIYEKINISTEDYRRNVGVNRLGHNENMKTLLMHVWRYPWFNIHYVKSSSADCNFLDIPNKIVSRFSIRIVPNQQHQKVTKMVIDYVTKIIEKLNTPNKIQFNAKRPVDPWYEDNLHWNYQAANTAIKQVYKEDASLIREGNAYPILLTLRNALPKRNIVIVPIVDCDARHHTESENISIRCYIEGTKLLASYFFELSVISKKISLEKKNRSKYVCRNKLTSF